MDIDNYSSEDEGAAGSVLFTLGKVRKTMKLASAEI